MSFKSFKSKHVVLDLKTIHIPQRTPSSSIPITVTSASGTFLARKLSAIANDLHLIQRKGRSHDLTVHPMNVGNIHTCTLAVTTEDPEAEDGLCGVDNGLEAPCVPLPVPPDRLVLLAPLELRLLPLLAGTFIAIPLKLFFPTVPVDDEFGSFEEA